MTLGLLLVIIALILAAIALFVPVQSYRLLAGSVLCLCVALLIGVTPIVV
jgi:hypothetical protein